MSGRKRLEITAELIPEEEGGYTVYCPELDIYTQGETEEEALQNLKEAAELHLEEIGWESLPLKPVRRHRITVEVHG